MNDSEMTDEQWAKNQLNKFLRGIKPRDRAAAKKKLRAILERELRKSQMTAIEGGGTRSATITDRGPQSATPLYCLKPENHAPNGINLSETREDQNG